MGKYNYAFCILFLIIRSLVFAQSEESYSSAPEPSTTTPEPSTRSTPVSSLFSNIGDLVQDIDEAIYRMSAPRENSKEMRIKRDETKRDLRMSYFDRIRENYEDLQKSLRESLDASAEVLQNSNLMNLNFQNKGHKAFLDLSSPLLSMNVKVKAKTTSKDEDTTKTKIDKETSEFPELPFSDVSGTINIGGGNLNLKDNKNVEDSTAKLATSPKPDELQKRSSRRDEQVNGERYNYQNYRPESKSLDDYPSDIYSEETDTPFETSSSDVQGRILGDLLFSESTFDKYFKRFLKDHGQWMLNPTAFPPKKVVENIRGITRETFKDNETPSNQWKANSAKVSSKARQELKSRDRYIANDREAWHDTYPTSISESRYERNSRIILAFTPEGVPLKLKIDHRIRDPLQYLHKRLSAAKVSLNIPVNSERTIQPVGNDILQLGSVYGGIQSNALYLDLSNEYQLNSLLRTLKKFRNEY